MRLHCPTAEMGWQKRCELRVGAGACSGQRSLRGTDGTSHLNTFQPRHTPNQPPGVAQSPRGRSPATDTPGGYAPASGAHGQTHSLPAAAAWSRTSTAGDPRPCHGGPTKASLGTSPLRVPPGHSPEDAAVVLPSDTELHPPGRLPQPHSPPSASPLSATPGRVRRDRGRERPRACAEGAAARGRPGTRGAAPALGLSGAV